MEIRICNGPLPENISNIIEEKGLKQGAIAEKCGYTVSNFSNMLNGRKLIKPCDVPIIAKALDVPIEVLFKSD